MNWGRIAAVVVMLPCVAAAIDDVPMRFEVGSYAVNLMPTRENVRPTISFAGKSFSFAYRTGVSAMDGDRKVVFRSDPTNVLSVLKRTAKGVRAEYVHSLHVGEGGGRRFVGTCSNEVVFADGSVAVRATLYPAEPGRYRFHAAWKASQIIVFPAYERKWVGTTLCLFKSRDVAFMNELTPPDRYDPKAWGVSVKDTGIVERMELGNVPDVVSFSNRSKAGFFCTRYKSGFEASAVALNEDPMHKPQWDKPFSFSYAIKLEM